MILESIRFGLNNILNRNVLIFTLLISSPLLFFSLFSSLFYNNIIVQVIVSLFILFHYPLIIASLILSSTEVIKRKTFDESNYKTVFNNALRYYPRFFLLFLLFVSIILLILLPPIVLSILLVVSLENLLIWLVIFVVALFFGFYVSFRLILSEYIFLLDKKGIAQSIKISWKITKGNVLKLFLISITGSLILLAIGFVCLAFLAFVFENFFFSNLISFVFQVFIIIYQIFSVSLAYNKYLRKNIRKVKI